MTLGRTITRLFDTYEKAKRNESIKKPIAWSLYQVWKWADSYEKPRKEKAGGKEDV